MVLDHVLIPPNVLVGDFRRSVFHGHALTDLSRGYLFLTPILHCPRRGKGRDFTTVTFYGRAVIIGITATHPLSFRTNIRQRHRVGGRHKQEHRGDDRQENDKSSHRVALRQ